MSVIGEIPKNGILYLWSNMFQKSLFKNKGIFPTGKRLQADDIMGIFPTVRLVSDHKEEALRRWKRRVGVKREQ